MTTRNKARNLSDTYTLHKETRRRFQRSKVMVPNLQQQFKIDLADVKMCKSEIMVFNISWLRWTVFCICVLCKLKRQNGVSNLSLKKSVNELGKLEKKQCDNCREFYNSNIV